MTTLLRGQCWGKRCCSAASRSASSFSSNTLRSRAVSEPSRALVTASMAMVMRRRFMRMFISMSANSGVFWIAPWNCFVSRDSARQAILAAAVALRGSRLIAAISPNISPALTTSSTFFPRIRLTSPSTSRYIRSLFWFSVKNCPPCGITSTLPSDWKQARATAGS